MEIICRCAYCNTPVIYKDNKSRITNNRVYLNKQSFCVSCYNYLTLAIYDRYKTDDNFGINLVKKIKVRVSRSELIKKTKYGREFEVYIEVRYLNKSCFTIRKSMLGFIDSPIMSRDIVEQIMLSNIDLVKIPDKKKLLSTDRFIDYVYNCVAQSLKVLEPRHVAILGL